MTQDQFNSLPTDEQEAFINAGGLLTKSIDGDEKGDAQQHNNTHASVQSSPSSLSPDSVIVVPESVENTQQEGPPREVNESSDSPLVETFDIRDPVELLFLLDDNIMTGKVKLHQWQIQFLLDFASGGRNDSSPFQSVVRACNGSGKDKFIIAPAIVWLCMRYYRARGIVTSSSGVQLDNQTCTYITQLCDSANRKFGTIWKCNYRFYQCLATQSPIICYATDEPGKAEGFHPLEFEAKMAIMVSEDKSILDDINTALNKCTGYTHRVHVSTPGSPIGHFYDLCSTAINRRDIVDINEVKPEDYIQYHITASMCNHLSGSYIKQMKRDLPGGEFGAAYKSQVLAEFGTTDEMVVIPYSYIWKAKHLTDDKWIPEEHNKGGLDLSDGGDETVLVVRNGNKVLKIIPFRFDNTEDTIAFLQEKFKEFKLVHKDALIFADCGGLGKPMLDRMKRLGWSNIRYCDNRARALRPKTYKNYGAETWFHFGDLIKQSEILLPEDDKLVRQLSTRYYKIIDGAVHQLLSKMEMRSRSFPSPDRADACVLAFSDYKSTFVEEKDKDVDRPFEVLEEEKTTKNDFSLKASSKGYDDGYKSKYRPNDGQKDFSSLEEEVANYNRQLTLKG